MKKTFTAYLIIITAFFTNAQEIIIKGKAGNASGKIVYLTTYTDQITYLQKNIADTKIDSSGNFIFKIKSYDVLKLTVKIDYNSFSFYAEPNKSYNLILGNFDYNSYDYRRNPIINPMYIEFSIKNSNNIELNYLINNLDSIYNDFVLNNFYYLQRNRDKNKINEFKELIRPYIINSDNKYFLQYATYKIASLEEMARVKSFDSILKDYFFNLPVLYDNVEYMSLFNKFFDKYIFSNAKKIPIYDLVYTINTLGNIKALEDSLGKDSVLRNEVFRELILIKTLKEIYFSQDFSQKNIITFLKYIAENSKFPEHREIAKNVIIQNSMLKRGYEAPDFCLIDDKGKLLNLREQKGKIIYLNFWATWSIASISELSILEILKDKYQDNIEIISISLDKDIGTMKSFLQSKTYSWKFAHFNNDFKLLDNYSINCLPFFVVIDRDGKILYYPAKRPSEGIDKFFTNLIDSPVQKKEKKDTLKK